MRRYLLIGFVAAVLVLLIAAAIQLRHRNTGTAAAPALSNATPSNPEPRIAIHSTDAPKDWKTVVSNRFPVYLEAARKGEVPPDFSADSLSPAAVEQRYSNASPAARESIIRDL